MIFRRELNINKKSLIIWSAILGGMVFLIFSLYPQFAQQKENLDALLKAYPEAILKAFDMDKLDFGTVLGFYAVEGYMMITLFGSIYAVSLASGILSKEHNEKTIEFLLSKPISRTQVITQKLLSVLANIFIFNAIMSAIVLIGSRIADSNPVETKGFILISIAPFFLHLTFASIAFLISCLIKKSRNVFSTSLGIVLVTYFLSIVSKLSEKFEDLKYITPFEYVNAAEIINANQIRPLYLGVMAMIVVISVVSSYVIYKGKDITV